STPGGFLAVGVSLTATVAFGVYAVAHRLDRRLPTLALTRPKFGLLLLIAPLALLDLVATARYLLSLDFSVVASCCSSTLDLRGPPRLRHPEPPLPLPPAARRRLGPRLAAALHAARGRRPRPRPAPARPAARPRRGRRRRRRPRPPRRPRRRPRPARPRPALGR